MEILQWILSHKLELIAVAAGVVTAASAVAALTPTPKDDKIVAKLHKVVNWLALNVGKAKSK